MVSDGKFSKCGIRDANQILEQIIQLYGVYYAVYNISYLDKLTGTKISKRRFVEL